MLDEKIYKNILIYDISYKTFMGSKPLRIWFDKIDGFIKNHDRIRYSLILAHCWFDEISDEKVVLLMVLIIILQESKLIQIILYLPKKY